MSNLGLVGAPVAPVAESSIFGKINSLAESISVLSSAIDGLHEDLDRVMVKTSGESSGGTCAKLVDPPSCEAAEQISAEAGRINWMIAQVEQIRRRLNIS